VDSWFVDTCVSWELIRPVFFSTRTCYVEQCIELHGIWKKTVYLILFNFCDSHFYWACHALQLFIGGQLCPGPDGKLLDLRRRGTDVEREKFQQWWGDRREEESEGNWHPFHAWTSPAVQPCLHLCVCVCVCVWCMWFRQRRLSHTRLSVHWSSSLRSSQEHPNLAHLRLTVNS